MQEYDTALKLLLRGSARLTLHELTGTTIEKWLDIELPKIQNLRLDLLGEALDGSLVHLELQSSNDPDMPLRMAEYSLGVYRRFRKFPRQVLLYVGEAPLRMTDELRGADVSIRYRTIDARELDGERLLASPELGDNVIAILARLRDHQDAIRKIVRKIAGLEAGEREAVLGELLTIAGLRSLETAVREEAGRMPLEIDLRKNKVIGPMIEEALQEGLQEGRQKGLQEGRQRGLQEGELTVLRRQIHKRFGRLPDWAEEQLSARSTAELEDLSERVLDAVSLEDLLET